MLAYQVWECTRSAPAQPADHLQVDAQGADRGVGARPGPAGRRTRGAGLVALGAEAVHARVDAVDGAQRPDQLGDVDPGAAVDLGRVLPGQHVDPHARQPNRSPSASTAVPVTTRFVP